MMKKHRLLGRHIFWVWVTVLTASCASTPNNNSPAETYAYEMAQGKAALHMGFLPGDDPNYAKAAEWYAKAQRDAPDYQASIQAEIERKHAEEMLGYQVANPPPTGNPFQAANDINAANLAAIQRQNVLAQQLKAQQAQAQAEAQMAQAQQAQLAATQLAASRQAAANSRAGTGSYAPVPVNNASNTQSPTTSTMNTRPPAKASDIGITQNYVGVCDGGTANAHYQITNQSYYNATVSVHMNFQTGGVPYSFDATQSIAARSADEYTQQIACGESAQQGDFGNSTITQWQFN